MKEKGQGYFKWHILTTEILWPSSDHKNQSIKHYITYTLGLPKKPKLVRFSNFEQFWNAEIILHWNHFKHFFLNLCLEVANLIWILALSQKSTMYFKYILFRGNMISHYCKREYTWNTLFSFGTMPFFQ